MRSAGEVAQGVAGWMRRTSVITLLLVSPAAAPRSASADHLPLVAINVGGPNIVTPDGIVYEADRCGRSLAQDWPPLIEARPVPSQCPQVSC